MKTRSELPQIVLPMSAPPFLANGQKFLLAAARLQAHAFRAMMRYQIEALGFAKRRCEADVKFVDDLAAGNELNDSFDVFATFMQNAATEYATEASKVISISSKLASDTAQEVSMEAEEAVENLALAATT
jgi:hypothetical protein